MRGKYETRPGRQIGWLHRWLFIWHTFGHPLNVSSAN